MDVNAAEATIDLLFRKGLVSDAADLYTLNVDSLARLERFGEKSARNLVQSIRDSREVPFPRVLFALGIRYVGETVASRLAEAYHNIDNLMKADMESLIEVDEIGERIAKSVLDYFTDPANQDLIRRLRSAGIQFEVAGNKESVSNLLEGKAFVISGVFDNYSRDELKGLIAQYGGRNTGSISGKTDYILAGKNMGPSKYEKAKELGIPIISEEEFLSMIS
jgi:DNA ligase (NAD+)